MSEQQIERMLHAEAESIEVGPYIPATVRRRIRRHQGVLVGVASLVVIGIAAAGFAVTSQPERIPPADDGPVPQTRQLTSGAEDGVKWRMELRYENRTANFAKEIVCIVVRDKRNCWDMDGYEFGEASVGLGYVRAIDRIAVIVKTTPEAHTVGLREISGTSWAALVASEGDVSSGEPAFFYRFFEPPRVKGILSVDGADVPRLEFSVKVNWPNVHTGINVASDAFPELRGFEGDKQVVASGPEAGGYSVIMRTSDSLVCLHMGEEFRCRPADAPMEPLRLWIAQALKCAPEDECGRGNDLIVITGEVGPEVARVGIRDDYGTSFVQVGEPFGSGLFSTFVYGNAGDEVELVAFDSSENELDSVFVTVSDGR